MWAHNASALVTVECAIELAGFGVSEFEFTRNRLFQTAPTNFFVHHLSWIFTSLIAIYCILFVPIHMTPVTFMHSLQIMFPLKPRSPPPLHLSMYTMTTLLCHWHPAPFTTSRQCTGASNEMTEATATPTIKLTLHSPLVCHRMLVHPLSLTCHLTGPPLISCMSTPQAIMLFASQAGGNQLRGQA